MVAFGLSQCQDQQCSRPDFWSSNLHGSKLDTNNGNSNSGCRTQQWKGSQRVSFLDLQMTPRPRHFRRTGISNMRLAKWRLKPFAGLPR